MNNRYHNYNLKLNNNKIFYYYLTLNYNCDSGYSLASLVKLGIIKDDYTKLLIKSAKLGNMQAKKALVEYYSNPRNYDENMMKRYI